MSDSIGVLGALLPFAVLFSAFLIFKMDALNASLSALAVEFVLVLGFYRMPIMKTLEASLWGNLTMWTGFLVLYTGQIFGQAYRSTGLLEIRNARERFHRRVQRVCDVSGDDSRPGRDRIRWRAGDD